MKAHLLLVASFGFSWAVHADEGMTQMAKTKPTKTVTVQSKEQGEDLLDQRGFGEKESEVRMMNLMMVGGSGYEGMAMNEMAAKPEAHAAHSHGSMVAKNETNPAPSSPAEATTKFETKVSPATPKVGSNNVTISITDSKSGQPKKGLKAKAQVYMTSMDMGTEEPRVREVSPGQYQLKANFSMKGPWAVKIILPTEEHVFDFDVTAGK